MFRFNYYDNSIDYYVDDIVIKKEPKVVTFDNRDVVATIRSATAMDDNSN